MENPEHYSNFVTPPDLVSEFKHTVLLVDLPSSDVEQIGLHCKQSSQCYNVYLYNTPMEFLDWMVAAGDRADAIIVNMEIEIEYKNKLLELENCYYYGSQNLHQNPRLLNNPLEYFVFHEKQLNTV